MSNIKHTVLFVCIHNSARSQMAEAFLKKHAGDLFEVESAGLEPGVLNPNVVASMQEIGIDISHNKTQSVFDLFKQGKTYNAVITVCDAKAAELCPIFPGRSKRIGWSFPDPSQLTGTREEIILQIAPIRDEIEQAILAFIKDAGEWGFWN